MPEKSPIPPRLHTRLTDLLGIRYPVIQGGMIWVSGWRLAAAVSKAGGLGMIGAGSMSPELLEEHIDKLRRETDAPFAVNFPVSNRHADAFAEMCILKSVNAVFTSAGSPKKYTHALKASGTTVVHVVPTAKLALKVEAAGCDAVVAEGTEAGGHNGFEEITSMVLWPSVVDAVSIPVIAAGGVVDGRSMAAAMSLGVDGVQVGSRFAVTLESSAADSYKQAVVAAKETDAKLYLRSYMPTRALENEYVQRALAAELSGASIDELSEIRGTGRAKLGISQGNREQGEMEVGQAAGRISDIIGAGDALRRIIREYTETLGRLHASEGKNA